MSDIRYEKAEASEIFRALEPRFRGSIFEDDREGYQGFLVSLDRLPEFALTIRDDYHFDYLSSLTGVDYYPENHMEVVYHACRSRGGPPLTFKVRMTREEPIVPSLVSIYPGVDFQEREAWDLLGVRFAGHPDLRRILMWEGFQGHPLRKDWKEPFFEEESKPFQSRWPDGKISQAESKNVYGKNVQYPRGFDPDRWVPESDALIYGGTVRMKERIGSNGRSLETDQIIVNLGPQHPSTHGVFRMVVALEGETIVELKPQPEHVWRLKRLKTDDFFEVKGNLKLNENDYDHLIYILEDAEFVRQVK